MPRAGVIVSVMSKTVFVAGATGMQGGAVADALMQRGQSVRGLTRNAESARAGSLRAAGAELVAGDLTDENALSDGMQGADAVFAVTTPFERGPDDERVQGAALIAAAKRAGIAHFVFSSVGSADQGTEIPHFESKYAVEGMLAESGLAFTVLRPVYFMENVLSPAQKKQLSEGTFAFPMPPDRPLQQVCAPDYGAVVAEVIVDSDFYLGRSIDVASDELTLTEQVGILSKVIGRHVEYRELPFESLGEPGSDMRMMFEWFASTGYRAEIPFLRTEFSHIPWHSFESWAEEAGPRLTQG